MDESTPLRQSSEFSSMLPSNETGSMMQNNSLDEAQIPSSSSAESASSSLRTTLNGLPRELSDYIYGLVFAGENKLVVFGRRGILPEAHEGPSYPEATSQIATKFDRVIYPGTHSPFGTQDADSISNNTPQTAGYDVDDQQVNPPQHAELSAYGASVRKSLRAHDHVPIPISDAANDEAVANRSILKRCLRGVLRAVCCSALSRNQSRNDASQAIMSTEEGNEEAANEETVVIRSSARKACLPGILFVSKKNYEEAVPFLYKSPTFLFEDFELSIKFLNAVSPSNLKEITKVMVYYPQDAEGTMKAITTIRNCPDLGSFYPQSNFFAPNAESRLRRTLVSFGADPADDYALAYNIATQGSRFYSSPADPTIPAALPSNLFPARWLFGVMCRMMVVSMPSTKDFTVWIGDTLELEFNSRRDEIFEAALLQFAALEHVDGGVLSVKKWGELFDNSDDQDARWHEVNWMKIRTLNGVEEMIRGGEHGALDRHALMAPDPDE
jgi:hypothetical protein